MKIRIKGNSIRLRLTKSELEYFSKNKVRTEQTQIGTHLFSYELVQSDEHHDPHAVFEHNKISVFIPKATSEKWCLTDLVGFSHYQENPDGSKLYLLIEKDFACLDGTDEDQSDNYPNPRANC